MEIYNQVFGIDPLGAEAVLLGFLVLLVGLSLQSEAFERLVGSRVRGPLYLAYGTYGLPLMILLMEVAQRRRRGGFRFLGVLVLLVVILAIIGGLALAAFLLFRYLRRRR